MKWPFYRKYYLPFCLVISLLGFSLYRGTFINKNSLIMPVACSVLLLFFFIGEKIFFERINRDLLEPDSLFFVIYFIFHFSYVGLFILGLSAYDKEVFYNPDTVPSAVYFCLFCLMAFLAGYGNPLGATRQIKISESRYVLERVLFFQKY